MARSVVFKKNLVGTGTYLTLHLLWLRIKFGNWISRPGSVFGIRIRIQSRTQMHSKLPKVNCIMIVRRESLLLNLGFIPTNLHLHIFPSSFFYIWGPYPESFFGFRASTINFLRHGRILFFNIRKQNARAIVGTIFTVLYDWRMVMLVLNICWALSGSGLTCPWCWDLLGRVLQ